MYKVVKEINIDVEGKEKLFPIGELIADELVTPRMKELGMVERTNEQILTEDGGSDVTVIVEDEQEDEQEEIKVSEKSKSKSTKGIFESLSKLAK